MLLSITIKTQYIVLVTQRMFESVNINKSTEGRIYKKVKRQPLPRPNLNSGKPINQLEMITCIVNLSGIVITH